MINQIQKAAANLLIAVVVLTVHTAVTKFDKNFGMEV